MQKVILRRIFGLNDSHRNENGHYIGPTPVKCPKCQFHMIVPGGCPICESCTYDGDWISAANEIQ